jgi:hypothetical protein
LSNEEMNDYENFEKGMIYMKILKKGGGSREKGGGGNEIHAPCACGRQRLPLATAKVIIGKSDENHFS